MPLITMTADAVPKVSPRPVNALVSRSSVRWKGNKVPRQLLSCLFCGMFFIPLMAILWGVFVERIK